MRDKELTMSTDRQVLDILPCDEQNQQIGLPLNSILLGAACLLVWVLAALVTALLNGPFAFDIGRLVPPGAASMVSLINSGMVKDVLCRSIVVGGILVQYRTIIVLVLAVLILVFVRLVKVCKRNAASLTGSQNNLPGAGIESKPRLTSPVGTGNMETGDIILMKLWRWCSGIWGVFRLKPETIAMTG
jgi:hypothetical protein